jgi:hypothetical protein
MAIWNILRTFGIFYDRLVQLRSFGTFFRFWYHAPRKIWQPWWSKHLKTNKATREQYGD